MIGWSKGSQGIEASMQVRNDLEPVATCLPSTQRGGCLLFPVPHSLPLASSFARRPSLASRLLFSLLGHKQPVLDVCRGYWFLRGARQCRVHASLEPRPRTPAFHLALSLLHPPVFVPLRLRTRSYADRARNRRARVLSRGQRAEPAARN